MIKKFNIKKTKQLDKIDKVLSFFYKKVSCNYNIEFSEVENILIVDFALIGDMVMNIPFLKNIRFNCPNAKITMVCMPWAEIVLGEQGLVDEFIKFDGKDKLSSPIQIFKNWKEIRKTIRLINKRSYQMGFEPKGDLRHTLFMHYIRCDRTITYNYTGGDYLVTDSFSPLPDTKHLIDEKLDLLTLAGFKLDNNALVPSLKVSAEMQQVVDDFISHSALAGKRIIGLHPGASNINKQYRFYPQLVEEISLQYGNSITFCIFEGSGEKEVVDTVCNKLSKSQYIRIKRSLKEYLSLVSICDYMICNDSAAGHIAAAYRIPTLVIFGPVKSETAMPRGMGRIITISKDFDCKPCTLPVCPLGTEECIKSIDIKEVLEKVIELMGCG